ncbi:VCBS domain-containing protein, partial [Cobetia amphilecti]|uniref:VCBS domain-containing protein n=1 Tax=Cobetia amphilecti TaxID=1055104 RepID=UPI0034C667F3
HPRQRRRRDPGAGRRETVTETYTVELSDGSTTTVDILITGVDDGAVISDDSGEVTEDGTLVTSGT